MEKRALGDTGLNVGVIGLGVEHLKGLPPGTVVEVVSEAVRQGVNYFDLVWSLPSLVKPVGEALKGSRGRVHLAVHLGSCYRGDKYERSRKPERCEMSFRETLDNLGTGYADLINLHYVGGVKQWRQVSREGGVLDLAVRLRDTGLGGAVTVSTHSVEVVRLAAEHPEVQSVMIQVNMANHLLPGRDAALSRCAEGGVGVVAMKPLAAGKLLNAGRKTRVAKYQTGGVTLEARMPETLTPVKCLSYALDQPGVCSAVTGVKSVEELRGLLAYIDASQEDKDYGEELRRLHGLDGFS